MMFSTRRPTNRIDVCNYNTLLYRDYDANIDFTKNYFLSQSPPPMTYRDLRSVMSNIPSSNVLILAEPSNPSQIIAKTSPEPLRRRHSSRKKHRRQPIDVYRTLSRVESRCSTRLAERDITNDEMILLARSFVVDHVSPSPTSGFFYPQNLPNLQKHRLKTGTNQAKATNSSSPSLYVGHMRSTPVDVQHQDNINRTINTSPIKTTYPSPPISRIQTIRYTQPTPPQLIHRTTPVDTQYEENISHVTTTTTTTDSSLLLGTAPRKQLHVYMPQIVSC